MDERSMRIATRTRDWREVVDARLAEMTTRFHRASPALGRAMSEATLASGKRFRARLLLIAGDATGGVGPALIEAACAMELAHTASLIFDDLPCMDDAGMRRGRPTTHIAHGECRAVLAGIALVTESLRLLAVARGTDAQTCARLVEILSAALGPDGLSAGQELDLFGAKDAAAVEREQDLKTGALFCAGFAMLGAIQRLDEDETRILAGLGLTLGRAFQSYDDLLDVRAEAAAIGKDTGRDVAGPGPGRGLLAARTLPEAEAHYDLLRAELDHQIGLLRFDSHPLAACIAEALPQRASCTA